PATLVKALSHQSMRWRLQAQRLLVEKADQVDASAVEQLQSLVAEEARDGAGLNVAAIHALHTLAAIQKIDSETVSVGLTHPSAGVRRNAIAVLPNNSAGLASLMQHRQLFSDSDPQVKLQSVLTLADMPSSSEAAELVVELIAKNNDRVLSDALTAAAAAHAVPFLQAASLAKNSNSSTMIAIVARVAEHVGRGKPDAESVANIVAALSKADAGLATAILDGMVAGLPRDIRFDNQELDDSLAKVFESVDAATQVKLLRLASLVGSTVLDSKAEAIIERISEQLLDEDSQDDVRIAAASDLVGFRATDEAAVATIFEAITPQVSPELARGLIYSVRRSQAVRGGEKILEAMPTLSPTIKTSAIEALLGKPDWAASLIDAAAAKEFDLDELSLEQKQALRSLPDEKLQARALEVLAMGGGLPDADRDRVLQALMPITKLTGNPSAGKAAFKKACANCHQYGDLGQKVGPNLTGMAVHPKEELLTHIIDPSRSVEGNYRMYKVLTVDDLVFSGMLAGESKTAVTIIDAQAKSTDILREDIEELVVSRKSVMPEGFEQQLSETELTDLLEFLTDTGPYVPYPLDSYATAISTKGMFGSGDNGPDRMIFDNWEPKVFNGIPFVLTDPAGKSTPNVILLNGPFGSLPPKMPKQVALPLGSPVKAIHMLGGVGGWNFPYDRNKTVSMIVRLRYADGKSEDHELQNGVHIADYIRRVDVPESDFAFALGDQQLRYLAIEPKRSAPIEAVELVKGSDNSAPIIMAITIERRAEQNLKDAVGKRFKIGVGVGQRVLQNAEDAALIGKHFQILTPENCMKPQGIHPQEAEWNFGPSDAFADFARENNLEMVGHCLVWAKDDRTDEWMMTEAEKPVSREKILQRIESHVATVVSRYADVASHWDVVNEAIGDSDEGLLRDSVYSRTAGMDFIVTAFKTARENDPDALLIYNDYNGHKPGKREKLLELLTKLKEAGAPVDAYGMQGHFELGDNSLSELRDTFEALRKLGIQVVVSELDIDVVKRGRWWADGGKYRNELKTFDPYREGMPPEIEKQMVAQYVELFKLFHEYRDIIARVSFWNLHDGQSWLNYFPWNRVNHPLLFDRRRETKAAFDAVYELLMNPPPSATDADRAAVERKDANSREAHKQFRAKPTFSERLGSTAEVDLAPPPTGTPGL
ncbi:MAG: endo-1,4-beta-xylanase, partial [Pirellulaceae bacterium]